MLLSFIVSLFIMNLIIGYIHIKIFLKEFHEYRSKGKVLVGRQTRLFKGSGVIMFSIDNDGTILSSKYSLGFALRPKFTNWVFPVSRNIQDLQFFTTEIKQENKRLPSIVNKALDTWKTFHS